ncbi:hypothetical protein BKA82DRAFT_293149 [Pisolithus tinctorius]|uniref:Uncharacterized protein n=1 Tax=Pisolithus tinctorius Marx 270 TaxID=870435 RepID=A0A0C3NKV6_PISTI|nr:hypothetical protein BKA82DRAFT_293149 [Pisolithus tinctorius]KIN95928.1 hypothetical protein M404DRAFT_293149 [Pisolithus tinctorius Marx 270]
MGIKLVTRVIRSPLRSRSLPLRCCPDISDSAYLEAIPALYSITVFNTWHQARDALDAQVAEVSGALSVDSFARLLCVIGEGIEDPGLPVGRCKSLIDLEVCINLVFGL